MRKYRALRILGYLLAAIGLIGVGAGLLTSSALIVSLGIRTVSALQIASYVALGVGAVAVIGGTIPALADKIKQQNTDRMLESTRRTDTKNMTEYAKDSLNPEKTRIRLEQLKRNNPSLGGIVDRCLVQMDRIDTYQERHKSLLDANEAIYLEDTIEVIDQSERRMCQNFRNIINCCILIEDTDGSTDELDMDIIESSLSDNEEELSAVSTLLKYSVAYINNYNRNGVRDRSELDAWLKIMKQSMEGHHA